MDALRDLAKELGYPGGDKLWRAAERRGLDVTRPDVLAFVRAQGQRQVLAARPKYEGKIVATRINDRWAADLIDYTTKPSPGKDDGPSQEPYQYILIVQDVFSRKLWAVAMRVKTPEVVQQAFEYIVRSGAGVPRELDTDDGAEFKGPFDQYLGEERIEHQIADPRNKNTRGTLDAAIRTFRQQLARIQIAERTRAWAPLVPRVVKAYNDTVHSALIGRAPEDVESDDDLKFLLTERAAEGLEKNQKIVEARGARLQRLGGFRNELPHKGRGFERAFVPRYDDKVHKVAHVVAGTVYTDEGQAFPTRHVLAVPAASEAVETKGLRGGNDQIDRLRLASMQPYTAGIAAFVGAGPKWLHEVADHMKTAGMQPLMKNGFSFKKALLLLNYHVDERGAVTPPAGAHAPAAVAAAPAALAVAHPAAPAAPAPPAALASLEPYRAGIAAFVGAGPKWIHEVAAHMKAVGMQPLMRGTLNYKKSLLLLGFRVDERGSVSPSDAPNLAHVGAPRPRLPPAHAAAALAAPLRRIGSKRLTR